MLTLTSPSPLSYAAVASYAEAVGENYDVWDVDGRANIDQLIATLGGSVEVADSSESLHVDGPGSFTIFVPELTSTRRDRFTKAHELGHYFLHYLYPRLEGKRGFERGASNRAETQANVFAAALMMPTKHFGAAWHELDGDAWKLARRFDVSPRAVQVRADVLNLT